MQKNIFMVHYATMHEHLTEQRVKEIIVQDEDPSLIFRHVVPLLKRIQTAVKIVTEKGIDAYDASYTYLADNFAAEKRDAMDYRRTSKELFGRDDANAQQRMKRARAEGHIEHAVFRAIHMLCDKQESDISTPLQ